MFAYGILISVIGAHKIIYGINRTKTATARQMAEEHLRTRGGFLTVDDEGFQVDEAPDHGQWEASYTVQQVVDFRPPALEFLEKGEL